MGGASWMTAPAPVASGSPAGAEVVPFPSQVPVHQELSPAVWHGPAMQPQVVQVVAVPMPVAWPAVMPSDGLPVSLMSASVYADVVQQPTVRAKSASVREARPDWCSLAPTRPLTDVWERVVYAVLLPVRVVSLGVLWATSSAARFAVAGLAGTAAFLLLNGFLG